MIRFACPACRSSLSVPESAAGRKGPCPTCGQRLRIPAPVKRTVLGELLPAAAPASSFPSGAIQGQASAGGLEAPARVHRWLGMRPAACLVLLFLLGVPLAGLTVLAAVTWHQLSPRAETGSPVVRVPLTEEQRIVWKKLRRDNAENPWDVAYRTNRGTWLFRCFDRSALHRHPGYASQAEAEEAARSKAQDADVSGAVVVDLFSGEAPSLHQWFRDAGEGVRQYDRSPQPDWEKAVRDLLQKAQQRGSSLSD